MNNPIRLIKVLPDDSEYMVIKWPNAWYSQSVTLLRWCAENDLLFEVIDYHTVAFAKYDEMIMFYMRWQCVNVERASRKPGCPYYPT